VNDELSYQGAGDRHELGDTLASHLGSFVGGGYASTGWKSGEKLGHYFWGGFDPAEHTAAPGLKFLREVIDRHVGFWQMTPGADIFPALDPAYRAMGRAGHEYVLGTDRAGKAVADLPPGGWAVTRHDLVARNSTVLDPTAAGRFAFDVPDSRAVLFHFKKAGAKADTVAFDVDLTRGTVGPGAGVGGKWDGGWRTTGAKGERIVFDCGRLIANGAFEARVTTPWGPGAGGKLNRCGLYEDARLTQSAHVGHRFYARVSRRAYKFSCVKAADRPFDRNKHENRIGQETN
jgi:hypothetical protein